MAPILELIQLRERIEDLEGAKQRLEAENANLREALKQRLKEET